MWRAVRLVVDTGVHYKHWTRQQMIDYFHAHTALDEPSIQSEVDRYIAWPGQALSYKAGQLNILEMREKSRRELGKRFDLRAFHDAVLAKGALPLDVLDDQIKAWIAQRKSSATIIMLLANVVETSRRIGATSKRLEKVALLAEMLHASSPDEIEITVSFLSGGTRQGNIGIGYAALQAAAIAPAANPSLSLLDVDRAFAGIASIRGTGAERQRREMLQRMLAQATPHEQEFVTRLLMGELRQGSLTGLMLDGLARATGVSLDRIRRAAMMAGGVPAIAKALMEEGEAGLSRFSIQLFQPVQPMLAQTAEDVGEAIHDLGEAALEYKFDGARVQAHKSGDEVRVFSRRLNEVTAAVPEVVEAVRALPARTLVLDGEVLSLDADGSPPAVPGDDETIRT